MTKLLDLAIANLADHTESVLTAHGVESERDSSLLLNSHTLPIPYANMISLRQVADDRSLISRVEAFVNQRPDGAPVGVNDSFSDLNLTEAGMKRLFSDAWSVREPGRFKSESANHDSLQVETVRSSEQLRQFDHACAAGFGNTDAHPVYIEPLLQDARYRFLLGRLDGQPVSGVFTFNNGTMLGIYALFTLPGARRKGYGEAVVAAALADESDLPVCTNASSMSRGLFERLGFRSVGKRTVWVR